MAVKNTVMNTMSQGHTSNIGKKLNCSTHPPDFFSTALLLKERVLGEAIDSLATHDGTTPEPDTYNELDEVLQMREDILEWAKGWGGVTYWDVALERSFHLAVDMHCVERWRAQLAHHTSLGRSLLGRVQQMDGHLPAEAWKVKELWRIKVMLVELLVKGITTLDIKTSIVPGYCTVYKDFNSGDETTEYDGSEADGDEGDNEGYSSDEDGNGSDEDGNGSDEAPHACLLVNYCSDMDDEDDEDYVPNKL